MQSLSDDYYFNHSNFALDFARKALNLDPEEVTEENDKDIEIFALAYNLKYWQFVAKRLSKSIQDLAEGGEISYQTALEIIEKATEDSARDRMTKEQHWLSYGEGHPYSTAYIMSFDNDPEAYN